jgi:hypothetical protein
VGLPIIFRCFCGSRYAVQMNICLVLTNKTRPFYFKILSTIPDHPFISSGAAQSLQLRYRHCTVEELDAFSVRRFAVISCVVMTGPSLESATYQQSDVGDNDSVCMRVPAGHFRFGLHLAFRHVGHCVVSVEGHVCVLQYFPVKVTTYQIRTPLSHSIFPECDQHYVTLYRYHVHISTTIDISIHDLPVFSKNNSVSVETFVKCLFFC